MPAKIDLSDIAHFVRVAEKESFSEAARALAVPTSTVSRSVARLEAALGVRLLERTTRKVTPTASGRALLAEAAAPLKTLASATERIAEYHDKPCGLLRVTVPADTSGMFGILCAEFVALYPDISVDVILTNRFVDLVEEGVDVALRAGKLDDSSLVAKKLADMEAHVYAAPSYLASAPPLRTPRDLEQHRAVLFRAHQLGATWHLENGTKKVSVKMTGRLMGDDLAFVRGAGIAGEGLILVPEGLVRKEVREGALVRALAPWAIKSAPLHIVVPSTKHLAPRVVAFRDFLAKRYMDGFLTKT